MKQKTPNALSAATLVLMLAMSSAAASAQEAQPSADATPGTAQSDAVASAHAKVAEYRVGTTTLKSFLADMWEASATVQGRVGMIAGRRNGDAGEFILGTCGDLRNPELVKLLDRTAMLMQATQFDSAELFWPDGVVLGAAPGQNATCERTFHLWFANGLLERIERLPGAG